MCTLRVHWKDKIERIRMPLYSSYFIFRTLLNPSPLIRIRMGKNIIRVRKNSVQIWMLWWTKSGVSRLMMNQMDFHATLKYPSRNFRDYTRLCILEMMTSISRLILTKMAEKLAWKCLRFEGNLANSCISLRINEFFCKLCLWCAY